MDRLQSVTTHERSRSQVKACDERVKFAGNVTIQSEAFFLEILRHLQKNDEMIFLLLDVLNVAVVQCTNEEVTEAFQCRNDEEEDEPYG